MTRELAELRQMLSAPSDAYSAGAWCEAANRLLEAYEEALDVELGRHICFTNAAARAAFLRRVEERAASGDTDG